MLTGAMIVQLIVRYAALNTLKTRVQAIGDINIIEGAKARSRQTHRERTSVRRGLRDRHLNCKDLLLV